MFWKHNYSSPSQIETLLAKENVTLKEIMDEDDILNECKVQNKALIDFLSRPEVLEELVTLTTTEPSPDVDERVRFKYPNIACEMLTCDIPSLNERLAGDKELLGKLYSFLDSEAPLNPLLASFFSKIMAVLIAKKPEQNWLSYQFTCLQVLDFLKAKDNFVRLLLDHLGTSAIMDLTLKLMTQVEGAEIRENILKFLDNQRLIQSLVALLDPSVDRGRHHNIAQLLCDFIMLTRDNQRNSTERNNPDPLLDTLESPETISLLLDHMLSATEETGKSETAIVGGIQVLLELLDKNRYFIYESTLAANQSVDQEGKQSVVPSICKVVVGRFKDFHNLLLDPPKKDPIMTTFGLLNPPLGNARLQTTRLLAALIACGGSDLARELATLDTMTVLLNLFFAFPWNNFLHTQVQACVEAAFNTPLSPEQGDNLALSKHLLMECKLIERILDAWKENEEKQSETNGVRQGYMGHLINIANILVNYCSYGVLGDFVRETKPDVIDSLITFSETVLRETNLMQKRLLGGIHPHTSNEDSDEYIEIPFTASGLGQQNFVEYQMQQLGPTYFDTYGYNDDDFKDGDDALQSIEHRSGMNFDLSGGDLMHQHELFKQVCAQNISTLDDADDQIFEEKDNTFQTVIEKDVERNSSSGSEDDNSPQKEKAYLDCDVWNTPYQQTERQKTSEDFPELAMRIFDAAFKKAMFGIQSEKNVKSDLKVENIEDQPQETKNSIGETTAQAIDKENPPAEEPKENSDVEKKEMAPSMENTETTGSTTDAPLQTETGNKDGNQTASKEGV